MTLAIFERQIDRLAPALILFLGFVATIGTVGAIA